MAHLYGDVDEISPYLKARKKFYQPKDWDSMVSALKTSTTLYVGNLSFYTEEEQIYTLFSMCGPVRRIIMGINKYNKTPCGFCFVEYYFHKDAMSARDYINGTKLDERLIRVDIDPGFENGRQYGRGQTGGQVRDDRRSEYDEGRGGLPPRQRRRVEEQAYESGTSIVPPNPNIPHSNSSSHNPHHGGHGHHGGGSHGHSSHHQHHSHGHSHSYHNHNHNHSRRYDRDGGGGYGGYRNGGGGGGGGGYNRSRRYDRDGGGGGYGNRNYRSGYRSRSRGHGGGGGGYGDDRGYPRGNGGGGYPPQMAPNSGGGPGPQGGPPNQMGGGLGPGSGPGPGAPPMMGMNGLPVPPTQGGNGNGGNGNNNGNNGNDDRSGYMNPPPEKRQRLNNM